MKGRREFGLVGAGGVNQSFVARMPALLRRLGAVKGSSLRVSRRIANGLRSGYGVARYADLQACDSIWICVPEASLDRVVAALINEVTLQGLPVVVCGVLRDSGRVASLRAAGASVATLNSIPESGEQVFVAEGDANALAWLRKEVALDGRKLIELQPGMKTLYWTGVHLSSHLLMPWIAGAVESFRAAGISRPEAIRLVQSLGADALRAYGAAGDRAWNVAESERLSRAIDSDMVALSGADAWLAMLHAEGSELLRGLARKRVSSVTGAKPQARAMAKRAS